MADKKTLLIVDDDKFLLEMYHKKFTKAGLEVDVAAGSQEALDKLRDGAVPDILALDIIMPGMDGLELLETIRKENLIPNTKIIMLTNESGGERVKKARELRVDGYIVKASAIPSEVVDQTFQIAGIDKPKQSND